MGFPIFFNLRLNFAKRSSWSGPQSAPGIIFADCIELLPSPTAEYNQSDFAIDHLVMSMSMCKVISCVVGKGCLLLTSTFSWQNSVSLCPASFCISRPNLPVTSDIFLTSYFCVPVPYDEKDIFFGVSSRRSWRSSALWKERRFCKAIESHGPRTMAQWVSLKHTHS